MATDESKPMLAENAPVIVRVPREATRVWVYPVVTSDDKATPVARNHSSK